MAGAPHFVLTGVERRFGERVALRGIDLEIRPGERVALIGPSGSGKTTLLRLLMASLRGSAGRISVDGTEIGAMSPAQIRGHRQRCGYVDQGLALIARSSVHGNVVAGCVPTWPWWKVLLSVLLPLEREHVRKLLSELGLEDRQWDPVGKLSGGQRQRVGIARALAGNASLLLADEPTAALDRTTSEEALRLLADESKARGATLIVSTHRVSQVLAHVDRVIGLREGAISFNVPAEEIDETILESLYAGSRERA